ncbi:ubiquitin-conjugating enzyme E2 [Aspergillus undulatus]|uniref:ubiquitin-conjugating enzyme E2 n=1 Tax=Aspergillus undulatus TaxID=1810928 RepID=UPI003CCC97F5
MLRTDQQQHFLTVGSLDEEDEKFANYPIFRYTELPTEAVDAFMATGTPPEEFIFVRFFEDSEFYSLIHESHLELVDRPLTLGDKVKRDLDDTVSGIVISTTTKFTLEPVAYQPLDPRTGDYLPVRFTGKPCGGFERFPASEISNTRPCMLYDVPGSELTEHLDFTEGDHVIYHQKVGAVEKVERDVVLLLENSTIVSPLDPLALELPVQVDPTTALTPSDLKERGIGDGKYVWTTDELEDLFPGQSVFVERTNLSHSDRPCGQEEMIQGYVLESPAEDIHIRWLFPNVFSTEPYHPGPSDEVLRASQLHGNAIKCDFTQPSSHDFRIPVWNYALFVGDRVRLRDSALAERKYPGYQRLPTDQTFGYDMNIFRVVSTRTEVTVRWQDGSCTTEDSKCLLETDTEGELFPGTPVALKDGVNVVDKSVTVSKGHASHFFRDQAAQILRAQIGIIQKINREQIASVRWFQSPDVELIYNGDALSPGSSLGRLSDVVTDVSLYELTTFYALNMFVDALVVVAPACVDESVVSSTRTHTIAEGTGPYHLFINSTSYSDVSNKLQSIKAAMTASDWFKETTTIRRPSPRRRYSLHPNDDIPPNDFFGKIVAIDTDGIITVRFPGSSGCHDAQVPLERILMMLPPGLSSFSKFLYWHSESEAFASSSDEYGLDTDGIEDNWASTDETNGSLGLDESVLAELKNPKILEKAKSEIAASFRTDTTSTSAYQESSTRRDFGCRLQELPPPGFALLEDLPPSDHHFIDQFVSAVPMKHIQREFEILRASLPPGIFVRSWESRMDLLRVLIIGPENTPYEHAPFVFDFQLPSDFPNEPPLAFFHSWTVGRGAVNPNLYEDGKICLSILGTWPTQNPHENWSPGKSTVLQVLVSILGLVLVKNPFYNEVGYQTLATKDARHVESAKYTEKVFLMTRGFIIHALEHPVCGLGGVLAWHYLPGADSTSVRPHLLRKVIQKAQDMIEHHHRTSVEQTSHEPAPVFCSRLSLGAVVMLQKHVGAFERLLNVQTSSYCL